jgi:hypothetical protein
LVFHFFALILDAESTELLLNTFTAYNRIAKDFSGTLLRNEALKNYELASLRAERASSCQNAEIQLVQRFNEIVS